MKIMRRSVECCLIQCHDDEKEIIRLNLEGMDESPLLFHCGGFACIDRNFLTSVSSHLTKVIKNYFKVSLYLQLIGLLVSYALLMAEFGNVNIGTKEHHRIKDNVHQEVFNFSELHVCLKRDLYL